MDSLDGYLPFDESGKVRSVHADVLRLYYTGIVQKLLTVDLAREIVLDVAPLLESMMDDAGFLSMAAVKVMMTLQAIHQCEVEDIRRIFVQCSECKKTCTSDCLRHREFMLATACIEKLRQSLMEDAESTTPTSP
jgi:hypothetical protein